MSENLTKLQKPVFGNCGARGEGAGGRRAGGRAGGRAARAGGSGGRGRAARLDAPLPFEVLLGLARLLLGAAAHKVRHVLPPKVPEAELGARRRHVELREVRSDHVELEVDILERERGGGVDEAAAQLRRAHEEDVVLEEVLVQPLLEVLGLARRAGDEVDLVRHEGDAVVVHPQVEVGVEEVGGEQPLELGLVDLRRRHRVLRVHLERAVQLRQEVAARVEEEDVVVHQQRVLGLHVRRRLQPRLERVGEGADGEQLEPQLRPRLLAQLLRVRRAVLPQRLGVRVDHAHAGRQHLAEVRELRERRRHRVLRADDHRDLLRQLQLVRQRVPRLHRARHARLALEDALAHVEVAARGLRHIHEWLRSNVRSATGVRCAQSRCARFPRHRARSTSFYRYRDGDRSRAAHAYRACRAHDECGSPRVPPTPVRCYGCRCHGCTRLPNDWPPQTQAAPRATCCRS